MIEKTSGQPNARVSGGNALSAGFTIGTGGGTNPLAGGLPFPTQTGNANGSNVPVTQTGVTSTRFYKGGAVQIPLANPADVYAATLSAYQQALGRNPTPQEIQTVLDQVNSQIQAKGASDIATANQQTQSMVSIYQGGLQGQGGGASTSGPGAGPGGAATPQQVYQEVLALGGSTEQAQVGAALVSGIESDGSPTELAGGIGPAQGLFQFEPGTWTDNGGGKNGIPGTVGQASWQQQVQVFVNASRGNNFGAWGPDLGGSYGYSGPPMPGSKVANVIGQSGGSWTGGGAPGIGQGMGTSGGGVQGGGGLFSPVGAGLRQGRTDEGVDFSGSGALYAVGSGTILTTSGGNSWGGSSGTAPGGTFIALKLDHPPDPQHSVVYYAEDIAPNVSVGDHVNAGEMIGQATGTVGSGVEIGWGDPSGAPQALAHGQSGPTAEGQNFLSFISGASPGGGASLANLTPQQIQELHQAASEPGGAAYLRAMQAQSGTGGLGQSQAGQPTVLQNSGGSQIVVTPPIANTYTQPASPADQALMDAIYGNPTQYQSNNLVNVFDTISQMLGAPKGQPFQQALSVP